MDDSERDSLIASGPHISSDEEERDTVPIESTKPKLTRRQWLTVLVFGVSNLAGAVCISLQAPFYPEEAEAKGASATEYGFVFGIYELTSFICCPIFGKYLPYIGPRFVYNAGIFVTAGSCMLFGVLDLIRTHDAFLGLSFAVRVVEALGSAGTLTASFSIIAAEFPQSVATTFASLETFFGLGLIAGPTIGGVLYEVGGFLLPFLVTGGVLLVSGMVSLYLLPGENLETQEAALTAVVRRNSGLLAILRVPSVLLAACSIIASSISIGFLSATLEPHLRQFDLSAVQMGLMFIVTGGMYAMVAPVIGHLCDNGAQPKILAATGNILVVISYLLLGPAPFIPFDTILWVAIVALMFHGTGIGFLLVSSFIDGMRSSTKSGFPDDISTYAIVSGLWASSFALGAFIGPSIGGILFDSVGFRMGSLLVLGIHLMSLVAHLIFMCLASRAPESKRRFSNIPDTLEPLLGSVKVSSYN